MHTFREFAGEKSSFSADFVNKSIPQFISESEAEQKWNMFCKNKKTNQKKKTRRQQSETSCSEAALLTVRPTSLPHTVQGRTGATMTHLDELFT